jgi:nucleotide-binding universal stress UspA family protein
MAKAMKIEVILVRAYSLPWGSHAFAKRFYVPYADKLAESVKKDARTYLEAKAQELQAERIGKVSYEIEEGGSEEIIDLTPDNMLAICTPRKSEVSELIMGNVTEHIIRHSDSPVLVVRG